MARVGQEINRYSSFMRLLIIYASIIFSAAFAASAQDATTESKTLQDCLAVAKLGPSVAVSPVAKLKQEAETVLEQEGKSSAKYRSALQALGRALYGQARQLQAQGCYAAAAASLREMMDVTTIVLRPEDLIVVRLRAEFAGLQMELGHLPEAEAEYRTILAALEAKRDPQARALTSQVENDLALLHHRRNEFQKAMQGFERALALNQSGPDGESIEAAKNLHNIALIHVELGQYDQAVPLYMRAQRLIEAKRGSEHAEVATILNNIASLHRRQGLYEKAEPFYKRALDIRESIAKSRGALAHPDLAQSYNNLGWLHQNLGERARDLQKPEQARRHFEEAEVQFRRTLEMYLPVLGEGHARVGSVKNNLAVVLFDQGRLTVSRPLLEEAAEKLLEAVAIRRSSLGPLHPETAQSIHRLGRVYQALGRLDDALTMHRQALEIRQKALDPEHTDIVQSRDDLASVLGRLENWQEAAKQIQIAHDVVVSRSFRGIRVGDFGADERGRQEIASMRSVFHRQVRTLWHLAAKKLETHDSVRGVAFRAAQRASQTAAEAALVQMSARLAKGTGELAELVRKRQDLVRHWQALDERLNASISADPARRKRNEEEEAEQKKRAMDAERKDIDARLQREFPEFSQHTHPDPLSLEEAQLLLLKDEALLFFLSTEEETFAWLVTRNEKRWTRLELGAAALSREVKALRCGLDATEWSRTGCPDLSGVADVSKRQASPDPLPFSHARAHALHTALFGRLRGLIQGKHLLIVPSGPLTELPFHVLVSKPPSSDDHKRIRWLARDHAVTVLPAVSSLKALRRIGRPSLATRPMIGFGNPLLDGDQKHALHGGHYQQQAALARSQTSCAPRAARRTAALRGIGRSLDSPSQTSGLVDLAHLRTQAPLPETADELCDVARALGTDVDDIRLGARATEREVKALSASGQLAQFRVMHFATHGTLAGQISGTSEPGLILTPPTAASQEDDGYLSASEIAGLKMDADWVILSACNTAGGAGTGDGGEALSGLARAFFYAQARALLVSHWEVNSVATVKLITQALGNTARNVKIGRAEALRRAMLALIESSDPKEAHPSYWAPFVVVGEGGPAR